MAYPGGRSGNFTGNPDADLLILFSLPDQELWRFCSTNKYLQELCTSPAAEAYWQERFYQRFPRHLAAAPGESWRAAYQRTMQERRLSPGQIEQLLEEAGIRGPCLVSYLTYLSSRLYEILDSLTSEEWVVALTEAGMTGTYLRGKATKTGVNTVAGWLQLIIAFILDGQVGITPWHINLAITGNELLRELLPDISYTLPILVRIGGESGTHLLVRQQFLGMMLYADYATQEEVSFSLYGCPLHYTPAQLRRLLPEYGDMRIIMLTGDSFIVNTVIMQGFITLARWLGRNYRLAYRRIDRYIGYA